MSFSYMPFVILILFQQFYFSLSIPHYTIHTYHFPHVKVHSYYKPLTLQVVHAFSLLLWIIY